MMSILLTVALSCPIPAKINKTKESWTKNDEKCYNSAKDRCKVHYPTNPCLTRFFKIGYQAYYAECGVKR